MNLHITHLTRYEYSNDVRLLPHLLYLRPRDNPQLQVSQFSFRFSPDARLHWMRDDFDNLPASAHFSNSASSLEIRSECAVTTADIHPFDFLVRDYAISFPFQYEPLHRFNLNIYLTPPDAATQTAVQRWLDATFTARPRETVAWLFALNQLIQRTLRYARRDEPGMQTAITTLSLGTGSCRDFAVFLIACARTLGLAARFVSGYLHDPAIDGLASGSMHAWVEVFLPGAGWRALDPTHGIFCGDAYVPVAHAVVAESVNPIQGSFVGTGSTTNRMTADVRVRRLNP